MANLTFKEIYINDFYSIAGKNENNGNLKNINLYLNDYLFGEKTFEDAEVKMQKLTLTNLINSNTTPDIIVGGELSNQLSTTSINMTNRNIPFLGLYSACATFVESLLILANLIDSKKMKNGIVITSSHNLSSERQFRYPIEYGAPKPDYSTFTCTGSVGAFLSKNMKGIKILNGTFGNVIDYGVKDAYNMGAVMAPAAVDTLVRHLEKTKTTVNDYDLILTGDLGKIGSKLFEKVLKKEHNISLKNYLDAGSIIYKDDQEIYSGGSGPVCLPLILFHKIFQSKKYKKVLVIGTGSLHNQTIVNQKHSLPAIAHAVTLEVQ